MLRAVEAENKNGELRIYQLIPMFQSVTNGIRRRRPTDFDFSSYAEPALIAEVVAQILCSSAKPTPPGAYLVYRDGSLAQYQELSSL